MYLIQNEKESTRPMTEPDLYYHRKYQWHIVALRFSILAPPWILRYIFETIAAYLLDLCDFLESKLPDPYALEKVPYEKLSKTEKRKPYKVQNQL